MVSGMARPKTNLLGPYLLARAWPLTCGAHRAGRIEDDAHRLMQKKIINF